MSETYAVNEIFYSLQGEGLRAGEASVFVRFAGCNQKCGVATHGFDCDTEYVSSNQMTRDDIVTQVELERDESGCKWVVFTGGEPGMQLDKELLDALSETDPTLKYAIETNGSVDISDLGLNWITVSPKVAEHAVKQLTADEVKYVRGYGQAVPKPRCKGRHQLISPATSGQLIDRRALEWCIDLVKANPSWKLSVQQHKLWGVR